jgi:putative nucleotidyltransferase with HDIG domain
MNENTLVDLDAMIAKANELAPLPASTVRLAQAVSSAETTLEDVAELIALDQALTATLLRGANSVASASATPVRSVKEAVMRLGTARVLALAVASSTRGMLNTPVTGYGLRQGELWRHSIASGIAAEVIPSYASVGVPPEAFTAAILHDIGKLLMTKFLSEEIMGFLRRAEEGDHLTRLDSERVLLSVHHGELGGLMAQHWRLPERIVTGIIYHHEPDAGNDVTADVTYLANLVAKQIEAGLDGRQLDFQPSPAVLERLGLRPDELPTLNQAAAKRYAQVSARYNA